MSSYADYSRTAPSYDQTRGPVGVEIILGCLADCAVPLGRQILLDAGCGTGNYTHALRPHVGRVIAVDVNGEMLERAREKCSDVGAAEFHQASIDALPVESGSMDGVMVNQVLHHLDRGGEDNHAAVGRVLREFARVLKPNGALVVNTCSQEQLRGGFWYCQLIKSAVEPMCARHIPLDALQQAMVDNGFEHRGRLVPVDGLMQGRAYFHATGPLDAGWRDGDSIWSTVSGEKLRRVVSRVTDLRTAGTLESYMRENDAARQHIGQLTFMYARKKPGKSASISPLPAT